MKRGLFIFICIFELYATSVAQKKQAVISNNQTDSSRFLKTSPPLKTKINTGTVLVPGMVLYEFPNFRGRSAPFVKNADGSFNFPFPLKQVSFRVPAGKIVYIKHCVEFPAETYFLRDEVSINLEDMCGIRTDEQTRIEVAIGGISTEVHNRDCKRIFGKIEAQVLENGLPGENINDTRMPSMANAYTRSYSTYPWQTLYYPWGYPTSDKTYDVNEYYAGVVYNNNPVPILLKEAPFVNPAYEIEGYFIVGKNALKEGRVRIVVKTNLVSEHKSCDLCADYQSNMKMESPVIQDFPINKSYDGGKLISASKPFFIAGPYIAMPYSRSGYPIPLDNPPIKHLRVHLIVKGL